MRNGNRDIYQEVTNRIVEALERSVVPWVRPWRSGCGAQRNEATGRPYSGVNTILLWLTQTERGYSSSEWYTYRQAKELGGQVCRGERGTRIVFFSPVEITERVKHEDGREEEVRRRIPVARSYYVFNRGQINGLPKPETTEDRPEPERIAAVDGFVARVGAQIRHGGDRAFYCTTEDYIQVPPLALFESAEAYHATVLHETIHWTGVESRLAREFGKRFGDDAYAVEELVAELGSAFACEGLGISGRLRHAEYLASWLKILKADKRAIFTAARRAQESHEFLRGLAGSREAATPRGGERTRSESA
ncbi:MAG: DUF1738 domain-containing protein [Planctomycetes bacterium]|nr:DUF1738 domain-containing protein [Planctomycetota bacterium]